MNTEARLRRERKFTLDVARDYKVRGYRVIYEPEKTELPAFLRGFSPDLIALGDHESVVIEVKTRQQLAASRTMRDLEEHVKREPGWRFELIVLPVEEEASRSIGLDANAIGYLRGRVDLALTWYPVSSALAVVLLTEVIEAALRQLASRKDVQTDGSSLAHLIKQLYVDGQLSLNDYEDLIQVTELRDLVWKRVEPDVSTAGGIYKIARIAKQLLRRVNTEKPKPKGSS